MDSFILPQKKMAHLMYFSCGWRGASSIGTCFTRCSPKPTVWNGVRFKPDLAKSWAMSPRPMWTGCSRWISAAETGSRVFGLFIPQKKWTCCFSFDEFLSFSRNVAAATPVCGTWREPSSLDPSDLPPGATLAKRSVPRKRDRGESRSRPVMTMTTFAARNDEKEVSEGQVLNTNASLWKSGPLPDGPFFFERLTRLPICVYLLTWRSRIQQDARSVSCVNDLTALFFIHEPQNGAT